MIDIYSKGEYPSNVLSNFYPNAFEIDGVKCNSMEGFLQSLKYGNKEIQKKICLLVGEEAKNAGAKKTFWKLTGIVHWQGKPYRRRGKPFQSLLARAYGQLYKNETFREALEASRGEELEHSIGKDNRRKTILTREEFLNCLNRLLNN